MQTNNAIQRYDDLPLNIREMVENQTESIYDDTKNIITGMYNTYYDQNPETAN
jgi:hypothetical protein